MVETQRLEDNITSVKPGALKGGVNAVDRHPAKDKVLEGGSDGTPQRFQMYRTSARKIGDNANLLKSYEAMPGRVYDVRFSADGSRFVAGSSYNGAGEVRVYNTEDVKVVSRMAIPEGGVFTVAFHPS